MKPPPVLTCETCSLSFPNAAEAGAHAREAAELAGWYSMARKGGRLAWRCPEHAPKAAANGTVGLHTGMMMPCRHRWVLELAVPIITTMPPRYAAICAECGARETRTPAVDDVLEDYEGAVARFGKKGG